MEKHQDAHNLAIQKKWPDFVENRPVLNLDCALKWDQIAITFINHATVLIQLPGLNILTDRLVQAG